MQAFRATIWNQTNMTITIRNDGGWSAIDGGGNYLQYNWESEALGNSNTDTGAIAAGDTYSIVLVFTDAQGNPVSPNAIKADFSPKLDAYTSIAWSK